MENSNNKQFISSKLHAIKQGDELSQCSTLSHPSFVLRVHAVWCYPFISHLEGICIISLKKHSIERVQYYPQPHISLVDKGRTCTTNTQDAVLFKMFSFNTFLMNQVLTPFLDIWSGKSQNRQFRIVFAKLERGSRKIYNLPKNFFH